MRSDVCHVTVEDARVAVLQYLYCKTPQSYTYLTRWEFTRTTSLGSGGLLARPSVSTIEVVWVQTTSLGHLERHPTSEINRVGVTEITPLKHRAFFNSVLRMIF